MAVPVPGESGKGYSPTSTFLGVDPRTLSKGQISSKANRERRAAAARKKYMEEAARKANELLTLAHSLNYGWSPIPNARQRAAVVRTQIAENNLPYATPTFYELNHPNPATRYSYQTRLNRTFRHGGQYGIDYQKESRMFWAAYAPADMIEQAQNDARMVTSPDRTVAQFAERYSLTDEQKEDIISWGQGVFDEEEIIRWVNMAPDEKSRIRRSQQVADWFDDRRNVAPTYTRDGNENKLYLTDMVQDTAVLPPWRSMTKENLDNWDYYKTFGYEVNKANVKAFQNARITANEIKRNGYANALSTTHDANAIDSYADVLISSIKERSYEAFFNNLNSYLSVYVINPARHGHLLTAAGNSLFNLMETMDIAQRGVRAFVAGDTVLGGSGGTWSEYEYQYDKATGNDYDFEGPKHTYWNIGGVKHTSGRYSDAKFEGQNVYWADIRGHSKRDVRRAQRLFMDNGGYALLLRKHPSFASKAQLSSEEMQMSDAELMQRLDRAFADSDIGWEEIYRDINANYFREDRAIKDLRNAFANVGKTYTDINATYNANTGSLLGDIFVESILDPGLIGGGIAKGMVKTGVKETAETALVKGFSTILKEGDNAGRLIRNKNVQRAVNKFISNNNGKDIIFKKSKDLLAEINQFMDDIHIVNPAERQKFRREVFSHLMDKQYTLNGKIISSQEFSKWGRAVDSKLVKSAYYLDKSIDVIDSAIVKSSFIVPWGGVKLSKLGYKAVMNTDTVKQIVIKRELKRAQAVLAMRDEKTGRTNVLKINKIYEMYNNRIIDQQDVRMSLTHVKSEYESVADTIESTIAEFNAGKVTDEEAKRIISNRIKQITGEEMASVEDLRAYIDSLDTRYSGDLKNAFDKLDDAYKRLVGTLPLSRLCLTLPKL